MEVDGESSGGNLSVSRWNTGKSHSRYATAVTATGTTSVVPLHCRNHCLSHCLICLQNCSNPPGPQNRNGQHEIDLAAKLSSTPYLDNVIHCFYLRCGWLCQGLMWYHHMYAAQKLVDMLRSEVGSPLMWSQTELSGWRWLPPPICRQTSASFPY